MNEHSGHKFGSCYYHQNLKICYVNIPKNASTTLKDVVRKNGFFETNFLTTNLDIVEIFTVIREPLNRYLSAVNYMNISGRITAYEHIETQSNFLSGIDTCRFFLMSTNLLESIGTHYNLNIEDNNTRKNETKSDLIKYENGHFIYDDSLINEKLYLFKDRKKTKETVFRVYEKDIELYKKAMVKINE
jgi:hypothetical protein